MAEVTPARIVALGLLAAIAAGVAVELPEIRRYLKVRAM
jgi:hypothetical protein